MSTVSGVDADALLDRPQRRAARRGDRHRLAAVHPRRRRIGQDPRPHPSHRLAGRHRRPRPAPRPRPDLHPQGRRRAHRAGCGRSGLHDRLAAGTFHSVAYAQLRSRWADRGIQPPSLLDRKVGFVARLLPASATRRPADRPGGRDRVGQGPHGRARGLRPGRHRRRTAAAPRARRGGSHLRPLRRGTTRAPPGRLRRPAPGLPPRPPPRHRVRPGPALALPAPLRRRVPGRQPAPAGAARRLAGRPPRPVRRRRSQPGHLRLERRRPRGPPALPDPLPHRARSSASPRTTAPRRRCWPSPTPCSSVAGRGVDTRRRPPGHPPRGPGARGPRRSTTPRPRPRAIARAVRDHHGPGASWSSQAVLVRTNAQIPAIEEAFAKADIPFRVRGAAPLLDQPEVKAAMAELRRARGSFDEALADLATAVDVGRRCRRPRRGAAGQRRRPGAAGPRLRRPSRAPRRCPASSRG